jgi:hypothetical protein
MTTCPHPEKRTYADADEAREVIRVMYRTGNGNTDLHPYRCPCGAWHIGHDFAHFQKRIKAALKKGRGPKTLYARNRRTKR